MTQQGIEVFLAVARLGSISAAAQALYITQPAVSRHLKSLEDALGCSLVVRGRGQRRVELTDQDFVQVAEKWRLLWQETREGAGQDRAQTLRVASVGSLVSYLLGPRRKEALTRAFLACLDRELNRRPEIESLLSLPDEPIEGGWLCT